jgi:RimJ/RimL family protein N-acetyltransferase
MTLVNINSRPDAAVILYDLLAERGPEQSISHRSMPSWEAHIAFMRSKPYIGWFLIDEEPGIVGAIYLSKQYEIGVAIFKKHQRKGFGRAAVIEIMKRYPAVKRFLWNANPHNKASIAMCKSLGFAPLQVTYALDMRALVEAAE